MKGLGNISVREGLMKHVRTVSVCVVLTLRAESILRQTSEAV